MSRTVSSAHVGSNPHLPPTPETVPDQRICPRRLILRHAIARGAEWACAAGYAKYMPKMIMGSRAAEVAWLDGSNRSEVAAAAGPVEFTDGSARLTSGGMADSKGGIIAGAAHMIRKLSPVAG